MNTIVNHKGRTVLDEPAIQLLAIVLSAMRKSTAHEKDLNDAREVLAALTISGYAIVPQGSLDAVSRFLRGEM